MFFDVNVRTEYEMLFKQAASSMCHAYGVKNVEECCNEEKPMKKKDKDDAAKSTKR